MAEINDFNVVDASNTGRWPENMAPSAVNNAGRADEGISARWHKDTNASILATTLSGSVFEVAANQTLSAYYDGLEIGFDANAAITGPASLNVDGVAVASIRKNGSASLSSSDIVLGQKVVVIYDGANWQMMSPVAKINAQADVITTRGDIIRGSSSGVAERHAVGASGTYVRSDGTDAAFTALAIVDDTSPQLGADLDANAFDIQFDDATGIRDSNDNEQLIFQLVGSAVNHMEHTNAAAGNEPSLAAVGGVRAVRDRDAEVVG